MFCVNTEKNTERSLLMNSIYLNIYCSYFKHSLTFDLFIFILN